MDERLIREQVIDVYSLSEVTIGTLLREESAPRSVAFASFTVHRQKHGLMREIIGLIGRRPDSFPRDIARPHRVSIYPNAQIIHSREHL